MLRQHGSFDSSLCDEASTSNPQSPYKCYTGGYQYPRNCHENLVYVMPSDSNESNSGGGNASSGGEPVTKNAGSRWREDETEALVEIWRDKICQTRWWKQSKGVRVNKEMWEEIAQLLAEREVFRTPAQCQIRMKNLLQFYRQTVDSRRPEKSWDDLPEYFDIVDRIMTRKDTGLSGETAVGSTITNTQVNENKRYNYSQSPDNLQQHHHGDRTSEGDERDNQLSEKTEHSGRKSSNKRKLKSQEVPLTEGDEYDGLMHYSPEPTSSNCHGPVFPPRKVPTYMKGEFISNHHLPANLPLYPTFVNPHRESCPGSCCAKSPYSKKPCKERDLKESSSGDTATSLHLVPPHEREYVLHQPPPVTAVSNLPNESQQKDEPRSSHACNYYAIQQVPSQQVRYRHNFTAQYRAGQSVVPTENGLLKVLQPHLMFNQDLLQLQYKQVQTLVEIEKRRLEIEEGRMREEKDANNRTSAFLLEAVKILAETFRKDTSSDTRHGDDGGASIDLNNNSFQHLMTKDNDCIGNCNNKDIKK